MSQLFQDSLEVETAFLQYVMSESKILPLVRYWVENFTKHKILKEKCTQEIIGFREKCPRKISFLGNLIPQKRQDWHFRTFLKSVTLMKKFVEKKTIFGTIFFENIQILDEFSHDAAVFETRCLNVSDFELTFHISSNLETKFQLRVRLRIKLFLE